MMSAGKKLLVSLGVLIASFALIRVNGWFALPVLFAFILAIMYSIDFAGELREIESPTELQWRLRILMSVPMALFALTITLVGLSIAAWVIYNTFVERLPQYTGGFLTFGIAAVMTLVGLGWLVSLFRRKGDVGPNNSRKR
jgi:NADH:ubiquinone oxidoreductase subunit K